MDLAFDAAQRRDMEAFRDFDRVGWHELHVEDAVSILPNGAVLAGRDAILAALAAHFDERRGIWSWSELARRVQAEVVGHIVYETFYEIPDAGVRQRALTSVTYAFTEGHWMVVADQGTALP